MGFSGYTFQDACGLAEWVLSEMEAAFPGREKLIRQTKKMSEKPPSPSSLYSFALGSTVTESGSLPKAKSQITTDKCKSHR